MAICLRLSDRLHSMLCRDRIVSVCGVHIVSYRSVVHISYRIGLLSTYPYPIGLWCTYRIVSVCGPHIFIVSVCGAHIVSVCGAHIVSSSLLAVRYDTVRGFVLTLIVVVSLAV
jgi:hypothetical protein